MTQKPFPYPAAKPIFPPWQFPSWNAVDDRVRGGSSISHLDPVEISLDSSPSESEKAKKIAAARFWGNVGMSYCHLGLGDRG